MTPLMLERLDTIEWKSLTHAYGEAADVPPLLRALLSQDRQEREDALHDLSALICHQETTAYSATAAAVPFLYELLASPQVPDKSGIVRLLADVAKGTGYYSRPGMEEFEPLWRQTLGGQGRSLEAEREREATEIASVRLAVSVDLLSLLPYLRDDDPELRGAVATALGHYPQHAVALLAALEAALLDEPSHRVRWSIRRSIDRLRCTIGLDGATGSGEA